MDRPKFTVLDLYQAVNEIRRVFRVPPCQRNPLLEKAAQSHAEEMWAYQYYSHVDLSGSTYDERIHRYGPSLVAIGEIIAKGPGGAHAVQAMINSWYDIESYRVILLDPNASQMGAGIRLKTENKPGNYWVIDFAV